MIMLCIPFASSKKKTSHLAASGRPSNSVRTAVACTGMKKKGGGGKRGEEAKWEFAGKKDLPVSARFLSS